MLLAIVLLAAAAAVLAALLVTHRSSAKPHRAERGAVAAASHTKRNLPRQSTSTRAQTTTDQATTTAPTTTAPTTTTAAQPASVTVPSLSGDLQSALQAVRNAGLTSSVRYVPSDQPRGTVVAQYPSGGASARSGSQVTVNVSSGASADQVSVPNTVGMTVPQAQAQLNGAGLHMVILKRPVTDQSQAGHVVAQSPGGGSQAPKGSRVLVYWGAVTK
jgi:serine/threonine-protein kinase